jgi:reverse gyrase
MAARKLKAAAEGAVTEAAGSGKTETAKKRAGGPKHLVVVESPAKARTLSKYLGRDFAVAASVGHIVDLPKSRLGVDVDNEFEPQQTRRVFDRLVGYRPSPLLWDKVRRGLSAGGVQSVAVRMICEREECAYSEQMGEGFVSEMRDPAETAEAAEAS